MKNKLMEQVVEKLAAKLGPVSKNSKLSDLDGIITLVDGSLINTLSKITWACWKSDQNAVRIHTQFDLQKYD